MKTLQLKIHSGKRSDSIGNDGAKLASCIGVAKWEQRNRASGNTLASEVEGPTRDGMIWG